MESYDFEVLRGDDIIVVDRHVEIQNPKAIWPRIRELAMSFDAPGNRFRVTNGSGQIVILVGLIAARGMEVGIAA